MDDVVAVVRRCRVSLVVLVEHEMNVIRRVSDRCVVLNFGRKIFEGNFDGLIADPKVQEAYLGQAHDGGPPRRASLGHDFCRL